MHTYPEVFSRLTYETAIIIFLKKNGEVRSMLATRNLNTVAIKNGFQGGVLGGHDKKCNINNGNVAVYDLIKCDARSFNIDRLIDIEYLGEIKTDEEYEEAFAKFLEFKKKYDEQTKVETDMF